jgi:hypothetical protein
MASFRIAHRHEPEECAVVYAAWKGFDSPLRGHTTTSTCRWGDHQIWWDLETVDQDEAMSYLPRYVADRAVALRIGEVDIP